MVIGVFDDILEWSPFRDLIFYGQVGPHMNFLIQVCFV